MTQYSDILVDFCGLDFLSPYFERQFPVPDDADGKLPLPRAAVIITSDASGEPEREFTQACDAMQLPVLKLHCPHIVATGMRGLTRDIAERIYKGSYVNIKDNDSRISIIHAIDITLAAALAAGEDAEYTLTDGTDPAITDLADAFSYRMGDKRLFTIKPFWARLWLGKKFYDAMIDHHTAPDTFCAAHPDFQPNIVTQYLRTHVYDESSL